MPIVTIPCNGSWHGKGLGDKIAVPIIIVGFAAKIEHRGAIRFILTNLPENMNITKVEALIVVQTAGGAGGLWDIGGYDENGQTDPCSEVNPFYNHCRPTAKYVDDITSFRSDGSKTILLGDGEEAQACLDVEAAKSAVNRFSLGFSEEGGNDSACWLYANTIYPLLDAYLRITYEEEEPEPPPEERRSRRAMWKLKKREKEREKEDILLSLLLGDLA